MGHSARVWGACVAAICAGIGGCATCPESIRAELNRPSVSGAADPARRYTLACPDRLRLQVQGRPDLTKDLRVEADGCLTLAEFGRVRVEGACAQDVADLVAQKLGVAPTRVDVEVADFASRQILMFGPAAGVQRVIPYQGPETVTDLLRRTGGLAAGASYREIHVVRPHVAAGSRPEVFPINLESILLKGDARSDVRLEPYDQVYIGETRGAGVSRCLPPWLRLVYPGIKAIDESPITPKNGDG